MKQKPTAHKSFLQRSRLTYRPRCTWLGSRLSCGEQAGTAQGRCSWETGQASSGRPAGTWDNTVSIHFYVVAPMTTLTGSATHHPGQPLLPIPKGQDCGSGNGLETLTVVKISNFTAHNALRFCILHQNISLFYYEKSLCELFWVVWSEDEGNFISASGTWNCSTMDYPLTLHWPTSHRPGSRPSPSYHEDLII